MIEKMKKYRLDIISLLLVIICTLFFDLIGIVVSILLLVVYYISAKKNYLAQKILIIICVLSAIFALLGYGLINNMESTGIDAIGEALVYGAMVRIGIIPLLIIPIILLIIDNRQFIFKKKIIIPIIAIIIGIILYFPIHDLITTDKVDDNIPTVANFENELVERGYVINQTNYRLYGIDSKNEKAIKLTFETNTNDKYPLYVYTMIDYPWIIYYANGDFYAARGKYWDYYTAYKRKTGYNEEKVIWDYQLNNEIVSETNKINVYDIKSNGYKKGNILVPTQFNYYSKNHDTEDSIFIDIPSISSQGSQIKVINRVDYNSLKELN